MKKTSIKILVGLIILLIAFGYYYVLLPAINIHSPDLWVFAMVLIVIFLIIMPLIKQKTDIIIGAKIKKPFGVYVLMVVGTIFIVGNILSSPIINAKKYQSLINVETRDFLEDINRISYDDIPILDRDTAIKLGSRKMGSIIELVSQFEVNELYSQINYKSRPTRVTPLDYGNIFKWLSNRKNGIPAYITIDMTTQDVELVKLTDGIKYSFSEPLNRNVNRYLRFNYPTYMFDSINFEIDDDGVPYWVAPVKTYTIGLFGGVKISRIVLLNAVTGELQEYDIDEVPNWIDKVYSADLLVSYYNYYGTLKNGFLNSILAQRDSLKTTAGYNFIALDDDVWVYTGVTSVGGDKSNVGFVLMNQRTAETRYYSISGAEEFSAMASAEGQVQHLGYKATFPLLVNIANEPTYFIALKDNAGLVKSYAMVNIEKYQIVAIGDTVLDSEKKYVELLRSNGITSAEASIPDNILEVSGTISFMKEIILDGNTHYFIKLDNKPDMYDINVAENIDILNMAVGSNIKLQFIDEVESYHTVTGIK